MVIWLAATDPRLDSFFLKSAIWVCAVCICRPDPSAGDRGACGGSSTGRDGGGERGGGGGGGGPTQRGPSRRVPAQGGPRPDWPLFPQPLSQWRSVCGETRPGRMQVSTQTHRRTHTHTSHCFAHYLRFTIALFFYVMFMQLCLLNDLSYSTVYYCTLLYCILY